MIVFSISDIHNVDGLSLKGTLSAEFLSTNQELSKICKDEIDYNLQIIEISENILVTGEISTTISENCTKCLESFKQPIKNNNINLLIEKPEKEVDLSELLRDELTYLFPIYPICCESCKGLCSLCGGNLNNKNCKCILEVFETEEKNPWDALENLSI